MADLRPEHAPAPSGEDLRHDEIEFNPYVEPRKSRAWLNLIEESEKAFEEWNKECDELDKRFANLSRLCNVARPRQYQIFWANNEVLRPAIYSRPPVPVVVPKFQDRRPVYQAASELLERCVTVAFDLTYINDTMLQVRDDLALTGRGVAWCRYEGKGGKSYYDTERVCIDFKNRRDFLHSISRTWQEVWWVAAASYLTRDEARQRFEESSGDCYQDAEYNVDKEGKDVGGADNRERAKFWEIWNKNERRVVWVAQGCEDILDEDDPHLDLSCFFPCPKPAYGTLQRGSLVPVPDGLQYEDQLSEIDSLTARIHALAECLEAKGFYPSGNDEVGDALQRAVSIKTPGRVLIPISNWAAFGGGTKDPILWLPIDMISGVLVALVTQRKQIIDDVYQIMGLSDIMRGDTDAQETLGAQKLKSQYGSARVRDKQYELQRIARDLVCITSEIICEKFSPVTMIEMSQTQLPTQEMQQQQIAALQQKLAAQQMAAQQMAQQPQAQQMAQQSPDQANALAQQAQQIQQSGQDAIAKIQAQPTLEQVLAFLRDNRARSFTLDIETDSTIAPDEEARKEQTTEFLTMLGGLLTQLAQLVAADPATAGVAGEILKLGVKDFRAGRSLDGAIDELVQHLEDRADQPRGDDPATAQNKTALQIEQMKTQRQAQKDQQDAQLKMMELQQNDRLEQMKLQSAERMKSLDVGGRQQDDAAKAQQTVLKTNAEQQAHQLDLIGKAADLRATHARMAQDAQTAQLKRAQMMHDMLKPTPQPAGPPRGTF